MNIRPLRAWRPPSELAAQVACPPYDVVSRAEAEQMAAGRPMIFFHVSRAEIDLPACTAADAPETYARAAENFRRFCAQGWLRRDAQPALFVYRQAREGHAQAGLMALSSVAEYEQGRIKKHEHTRNAPETDRTRNIEALNAQGGPVFLAFREDPAVRALLAADQQGAPLFQFVDPAGTEHTVWRVRDPQAYVAAFRNVPDTYIADGHHRAAAACRVARARRADPAVPEPSHPAEWFMTVLFPAPDLCILPYNRQVLDLNGLGVEQFLAAVRAQFQVDETSAPAPTGPGCVHMYVGGRWYALTWARAPRADVLAALDCNVLQERLLKPMLGIDNPRENPRITFIGGARGTRTLEERVQAGGGVAFSMYPVTMEEIMQVADQGRVMPPKSTWFEPKLASGLFVNPLDNF